MTPQELKNSILQLAIQGKLVEQRPEEGTAEELYQMIQSEKQKLIKAGTIKKEKPLQEITEDEKPFDIPESWKWVHLSELGKVVGGGTPKTENPDYWDDAGIPWLTPADMKFITGKYAERGERNISSIGLENSSAQLMPKGTIMYSSRAPIGYIALAANNLSTNQGFKSLVPTVMEINEFMFYCLMARTSDIVSRASGTTFKEISGTDFGLTIVPLPPLAEQKRIVAKIEELLPYIDRYEKAWSKLEDFNKRFPGDIQKSILQMAIQGNLVEQRPDEGTGEELYKQIQDEKQRLIKAGTIKKDKLLQEITEDEKPFDIPESWKWLRFANLCSVLTCGYASTPTYVSKEDGMPFISAKNVKPYRFLPDDHKYISHALYEQLTQNAKPEIGDILLTRVGAGIGEAAIIDVEFDFAIYVSLTLIKLVNSKLIDNKYILFWLNSPLGVMSAKKNIYGKNASQGNLNVNNVRDFLVPLPPIAEQKRIVAKLEKILPLCEKLK